MHGISDGGLKIIILQESTGYYTYIGPPEDYQREGAYRRIEKFLQDEFAALLVKGRFDNNTSQLFCSLQKSNSGVDEHSLQNVRVAAELASIANRYPPRQNRGEYRGRGRRRGDRDMFQPFRGTGFPRYRG